MAIKQLNELISIQTMIPADLYNPCRIRKKQQRSCGLILLEPLRCTLQGSTQFPGGGK